MSTPELHSKFLTEFTADNINIGIKWKTVYENGNYRNGLLILFEVAELVETGGNYDSHILISYYNALKNFYNRKTNYLLDDFFSEGDTLPDTGEYLIEDNR